MTESGDSISSSKRNGFCTPLLPYLLSAIAAFLCAAAVPEMRAYSGAALSLGIAAILVELTLRFAFFPFKFAQKTPAKVAYVSARLAGAFLIFVFYFYFRVPRNPYENFAPRDAVVRVCIADVSRGANDSRHGTASVVSAPDFARKMEGMKIWYSVFKDRKSDKPNIDFAPSQILEISGTLAGVFPQEPLSRGHASSKESGRAFEKYLSERFVYFKITARGENCKILSAPSGRFGFYDAALKYMDKSLSVFAVKGQGESDAARAYQAMILGDKSRLSAEQKEGFIDTGTMHVFAISGLHVGFASAFMYAAMTLFRVNRRIQPFAALPLLYVYVCACGGAPSAMRAFSMIAIIWSASVLSRGVRPIHALVLAAAGSLLISPTVLFEAGFSLSYGIAASIFVYGVPLYESLRRARDSRFVPESRGFLGRFSSAVFAYLAGGFSISIGAAFAAMPLTAHYFSYFSPASVIYSPFFVTGAGLVVGLGFAGFALPSFLAQFTNTAAAWIVGAMSDAAVFGANFADLKIAAQLPSAFSAFAALFAFLALSAAFERNKPAVRFVLAPAASAAIMGVAFFINA